MIVPKQGAGRRRGVGVGLGGGVQHGKGREGRR
jgi:hypothetical protein